MFLILILKNKLFIFIVFAVMHKFINPVGGNNFAKHCIFATHKDTKL